MLIQPDKEKTLLVLQLTLKSSHLLRGLPHERPHRSAGVFTIIALCSRSWFLPLGHWS